MKLDLILFLISLAAIIALIVLEIIDKKRKGELTIESAEEIALSVISKVALALLTDAEKEYGGGTGELKMSAVLARLIALLPSSVVSVVPKSLLQDALENALEIAKLKWNDNPDLLK